MKKFLISVLSALLVLSLTVPAFAAEPALIGIPDDGTNLSRGIKLLEAAGLLKVDPAAGYTPEVADITGYLYDVEVVPVAGQHPALHAGRLSPPATINGTYAIPYRPGALASDGLIIEKPGRGAATTPTSTSSQPAPRTRTARPSRPSSRPITPSWSPSTSSLTIPEAYFPAFDYDADAEFTVDRRQRGPTIIQLCLRQGRQDRASRWACAARTTTSGTSVQKVLDDEGAGIYIELVEFDAYTLPNEALDQRRNRPQRLPAQGLSSRTTRMPTAMTWPCMGDTLIAPLTLYSKKADTLDALKELVGAAE